MLDLWAEEQQGIKREMELEKTRVEVRARSEEVSEARVADTSLTGVRLVGRGRTGGSCIARESHHRWCLEHVHCLCLIRRTHYMQEH